MSADDSEHIDPTWDSDGEEEDNTSSSSSVEDEDANPDYEGSSEVRPEDWGDEGFLRVFPFTRIDYYNVGKAVTPLDYFNLFFDSKFLSILTTSINGQAERLLLESNLPNSRSQGWHDTNLEEIRVFIALVLHMGHIKVQKINDYWRSDILYNLTFRHFMTRDRFLLILSHLTFLEPDSYSNTDESQFVKPIMTFFNVQNKNLVYPSKNLIISESQVAWDDRDGIGQFIRGKKKKHGVKMFEVTDSNGITVKMHAHCESNADDLEYCDDVIMALMDDYLNAGHSFYVDRFFTSVTLAEKLLDKRTYLTGRLKTKGFRNVFPRTVVKEGAFATKYNPNGLCVIKSLNKKNVLMITTEHHSRTVECNKRGQVTLKPNLIVEYKKNMGSVLRKNQMLAYCPSIKRSTTWYKKIIIYVMEVMVLNAFTMFSGQAKVAENSKRTKSFLDFRLDIVEKLLKLDGVTIREFPAVSSFVTNTLTSSSDYRVVTDKGETHLLEELPRNDKGKRKRRNCRHCLTSRNVRKAAKYFCPVCEAQPGLCITCFRDYHKNILDKKDKVKENRKKSK